MNHFQLKRNMFLLTAVLLLLFPWQGRMASGIVGSWSGTIKAGEFSFAAKVSFSEGGSFSIKAGALSSSGSYSASDSSITLSPSSPPGFSAATMSLSFSDGGNRAFLSGTINGLKGTLSIKRRVITPPKNPLYAVWQTEAEGVVTTLKLYESGWFFWYEDYETGANTRLLRQIRAGIVDGTLTNTEQILALIEKAPLYLAAGGKMSTEGNSLLISPLQDSENAAVPAIWSAVWDKQTEAWRFQAEVNEGQLHLRVGDAVLLFDRLKDSAAIPEHEMFRLSLELSSGDKGALVRILQLKLAELGLLSAQTDGLYGVETKKAVQAFEALHGLAEDGRADVQMLRLLYGD